MFGGYTPHRSAGNTSDSSRRAMFLTYNPLSQVQTAMNIEVFHVCSIALLWHHQGDFHEEYYAAKHAGSQGFNGAHAISFQQDFQGVIID